MVSPPTRGWTLVAPTPTSSVAVSPPTRGWTRGPAVKADATGSGFPRPRGDGPRIWRASVSFGTRFPRPRGDGPRFGGVATGRRRRVSPPTRGWTVARRPFVARSDQRFPRPRGDGPQRKRLVAPIRRVSPPTRGWTWSQVHGPRSPRPASEGFPAHAGMDLCDPLRPTASAGFPRPRGDGPRRTAPRFFCRGHRFPRPRGDGPFRGLIPQSLRFPRPRGDGPFPDISPSPPARPVSPPTRGWTLPGAAAPALRTVSPPTRGWTRVGTVGARTAGWFPRPRGDGPSEAVDGFPAHRLV